MDIDNEIRQKDNREIVRSINGKKLRFENCLGFCNSAFHKGYLSESLMKKHKCLEKNCINLKKIESNRFWQNAEKEAKKKLQVKEQKRNQKITEQKILDIANNIVVNGTEVVLCKHIYGNTYLLVVTEGFSSPKLSEILNAVIPDIHVYIRNILESNKDKVVEDYLSLLPDNMQYYRRKFQDERKRKGNRKF